MGGRGIDKISGENIGRNVAGRENISHTIATEELFDPSARETKNWILPVHCVALKSLMCSFIAPGRDIFDSPPPP